MRVTQNDACDREPIESHDEIMSARAQAQVLMEQGLANDRVLVDAIHAGSVAVIPPCHFCGLEIDPNEATVIRNSAALPSKIAHPECLAADLERLGRMLSRPGGMRAVRAALR